MDMYIKLNLDIDMSIDEVIEHATADVEFYENQLELLKEQGYVLSDTSTNHIYDAIRYSKSIIRLLGDLKLLRLDSCMIHMPERLQLVENGYNKALNDFVEACDNQFVAMYGQRYIDMRNIKEIAEQLKAGGVDEYKKSRQIKEI